jgi:hypothetical protein
MDETQIRKWLHDLNNRVGMILANAELMQLDHLSPRSLERSRLIEEKSLELRQIVRDIAEHLFGK